ncbi:MAG: HepT-like ribonuclease domain-containing protein [Segetibacter sp.]
MIRHVAGQRCRSDSKNKRNCAGFVSLRNRIIHGYDTVSDEIIWSIVTNYFTSLKLRLNS